MSGGGDEVSEAWPGEAPVGDVDAPCFFPFVDSVRAKTHRAKSQPGAYAVWAVPVQVYRS